MLKKLTVLILLSTLLTVCIPATPIPTEEPVQTEAPVAEGPITYSPIETDGTTEDHYMEAFGMIGGVR